MPKTKQEMGIERVTNTHASRFGIVPGRRVRDDQGGLWVITEMRPVGDADASDCLMVRWSPLMKAMSSDPSGSLLTSRRG